MIVLIASLVAFAVRTALAWQPVALVPGAGDRTAVQGVRGGMADVLARVGRSPLAQRLGDPDRLARRVVLAGLRGRHDEIAGIRVLSILATVAACGCGAAVGPPTALLLMPVGAAAAFRLPDMAVARMAKRRQQRIAAKVPELVELLVTTTRAGLSPALAFRRSVGVLRGPLAEEVALAVHEMDLGLPWSHALDAMVRRNDVPALRRLAVALERSRRLGTSIGATLRSVAEDLRAERRTIAEESARRAPVKMLFPLVFLVLPAFLLLTVGPVVLATVRSLR